MRALRRHHRARIRRRARRLFPHWTDIDKLAEHLQFCSCPYCINPRRLAGHPPTRQERVADMQLKEALAAHYHFYQATGRQQPPSGRARSRQQKNANL